MLLGIDKFLSDKSLLDSLRNKKIAFLGNAASVTKNLEYSIDKIIESKLNLSCAFGAQHGMRGEKQDNMIESEDYLDSRLNIPIYSLYGDTRHMTDEMINLFDVLLVDIQDVGTRVYTFLTTLFYIMEDLSKKNKSLWILDRPNPAGRPIEGLMLKESWKSFVGADYIIMRHGLTLGEIANYFFIKNKFDIDFKVIKMEEYDPNLAPGYGWPLGELSWVNPSPNASNLSMVRCYPGTVLLEGTNFSEGRGTTRPLECFGASDIDQEKILKKMYQLQSNWLGGCKIRIFYFEPAFNKFKGQLCYGMQLHVDDKNYNHFLFKPFRLISLWLKSIKILYPDYNLWRDFVYEYEISRKAIDVITGSDFFRQWIDDNQGEIGDLSKRIDLDEKEWINEISTFKIY